MENILKIDKIEKYYGNKSSLTKAIDNLSFDVEKGEFVAIMGASGSGKTTLLNCISTIDKVTSGHIYVAGNDITKLRGNSLNKFRREELGFIFQDFNLLDTLTAYENIALALPHLSEKERLSVEKKFYKHMCDMFLEMIKTLSISQKEIEKRFTFSNMEVYYPLDAAVGDLVGDMTWDSFVGYTVSDTVLGLLGPITMVDESTLNVLLQVDYKGNEILIPAVEEIITGVDHDKKQLEVTLPDGLLDL